MENYEARNIIFFGPPGTGKSCEVKAKTKEACGSCKENTIRTTFHPEYSYYDFVGQYKPVIGSEETKEEIRDFKNNHSFLDENRKLYKKPSHVYHV